MHTRDERRSREELTELSHAEVFDRLAARLPYLTGDVNQDALYGQLAALISRRHRPPFYLEMPPALFGLIVEHLAAAGLLAHARVAVERQSPMISPRGAAERRLNAALVRDPQL